jgi:hypothetical protein
VDYLTCSRVYPPIELMQFVEPRGPGPESEPNWPDWDAALTDLSNPAVRDFYAQQVRKNQENRLRGRELIWRIKNQRRFYVSARREYAYVWQSKRFHDDIEFWKSRLGANANVKAVDNERAVRFYLRTARDFQEFLKAVTADLANAEFFDPSEDTGPETEEHD